MSASKDENDDAISPIPLPSPFNKSVTFSDMLAPSSSSRADRATTSTALSSSTASPKRPEPARRRSSMKENCQKANNLPPKEQYCHPDKVLRRLRLKDAHGQPVNLQREFRDTILVGFIFGSTWRGASTEPYEIVTRFAERHPHRFKLVYVSVDSSYEAFVAQTTNKPWLTMQWHDGSNSPSGSPNGNATEMTPTEPFLMPHDEDIEAEVHQNDHSGSLYLRPWSRAFLAEHFRVLGVPNLVVYHLPTGRVLTNRARMAELKPPREAETYEKWERGEQTTVGVGEVLYGMRWSLALGAVGAAYLFATKGLGFEDVVQSVSRRLTENYLGPSV